MRLRFFLVLLTMAATALSGSGRLEAAVTSSSGIELEGPILVRDGETVTIVAPHHTPGGEHEDHYFAVTGDEHHFAWYSVEPSTPGPIVIGYDFRPYAGFPNLITPGQMARAEDALAAWSEATGGKLVFFRDTVSPDAEVITIGTGDLAALGLGFSSGPGGVLGLGGGTFDHSGAVHEISRGIAWQDFAEVWDESYGNGDPPGTVDYFTVAAQEIGHALGLGHSDDTNTLDLMNSFYTQELVAASPTDVDHIRSVYGFEAIFADGFESGDTTSWSRTVP